MFMEQSATSSQNTRQNTGKNQGQLLALGDFVFKISTLVYQQLERQNAWRHAAADAVGAYPAMQFTGPELETRTLSGTVYKEFSDLASLDTLREMADSGEAYVLIDTQGVVFGQYVITALSEKGTYFDTDGKPLRVDFTLSLTLAKRQTEEDPESSGKSNEDGSA